MTFAMSKELEFLAGCGFHVKLTRMGNAALTPDDVMLSAFEKEAGEQGAGSRGQGAGGMTPDSCLFVEWEPLYNNDNSNLLPFYFSTNA
jgi:hypothetical protein